MDSKNKNNFTPSKQSSQLFNFTLENNLSNFVDIFWIDYNSNAVFYAKADASEKIIFLSYEGHSWIIKDENNQKRELILGKQSCQNVNCVIKVTHLKIV